MRVLVTGSNGQLGNEIRKIAKDCNHTFIFTDIEQLDICCEEKVESFVAGNNIDTIINCAAYTSVDKAEEDEEKAYEVNSIAPKILAIVANKYGARLIHISTDYVFDGKKNIPYTEEDSVSPICVYGKTKFIGEENVTNNCENSVIVRTAWLFSSFGNNFVKKMIKLSTEQETIKVVSNQKGTPTYAADLANLIFRLIDKKDIKGVFHFSNEGVCSWYDLACEVMSCIGVPRNKLIPVSNDEYPQKAERPIYSALDKTKIKNTLGIEIRNWKDALRDCIDLL